MMDRTTTQFSHVKPGDTEFVPGGLRVFFSTATWALPKPRTARSSRTWSRRTWHQKQQGLAPPCGGFSDGCWGQGLRPLHVRTNQPPAL